MHAIGIDMSKDTFHAAFDDSEVLIFDNTNSGIWKFVRKLTSIDCQKSDITIGVEATGVYHLLLCEQLRQRSWTIKVINPLITHRMFQSSLRKVKTDKHDALGIRKAVIAGAGYDYTDTPEVLALKTLFQEREALCAMRSALKQRIKAHNVKKEAAQIAMHDSYSNILKAISAEMAAIEDKMSEYLPETQGLLRSIPGIGRISAAALVAYIGDIKRFSSPEKLTAYIGLDARVHQSGTSINGKGYMTKRGNPSLRSLLFNAAFIARQRNPGLKRYFEKKTSEGKHYFSALCAVERKLVHIVFAVWTRGTPFEKR